MKKLILILLILMFSTYLFAQGVTTASINGIVKDEKGNPLIGANVIAIHEPSGTLFGAATREDGHYNVVNVRVGGPYTISASYVGYTEQKILNIQLVLGENRAINFILSEATIETDAIIVTAMEDPIFSASRTGANTNISTEQIETFPTIQRSIQDFARLSPQIVGTNIGSSDNIGGSNIAGKNNRYNNIQVDGAIINDAFGLPASGTPGGQANSQPIGLDAIQEFQVSIAPYDIRQSGFTGGLINAITRSGTNNFESSFYYFTRNQNFIREELISGKDTTFIADFDEYQLGFRVGGPIIKNKLFFFVNGEIKRRDDPREGLSSPNVIPGVSEDSVKQIINIAKTRYGYDAGSYNPFTANTDDNKIFLRLDYNISPEHRFTMRHNFIDADLDRGMIRSSRDLNLSSQGYVFNSMQNSTVAQLNSAFGNNMANEARFTYTTIRDKRDPNANPFPQVEIDMGPDVNLGIERFSQANALDQDLIEFTDNFLYFKGNHTFTFGTHNEFFTFKNLFIQDFYGRYVFKEIGDTSAIEAFNLGIPVEYSHSYSLTDKEKQMAEWSAYQLGFYAQDEWKVMPNLTITCGLRADIPIYPDKPFYNEKFDNQFEGLSTDKVPSGNILWSPRLGFNYDLTDDRSTQIRGGLGMFSGGAPYVWISNQYSNTGVDFGRVDVDDENGLDVGFEPDPYNQPRPGQPGVDLQPIETSEINIVDEDFKFPQVFRTNVAVDHKIMPGYIGTLEFIYTTNINDVMFRNINLKNSTEITIDGRPLYYSNDPVSEDFTRVILLENSDEGYQYNLTVQLQKQPGFGDGLLKSLSGNIAYTYGRALDGHYNGSSRAISNWKKNPTKDPNKPEEATSAFEIRHRFLSSFSYNYEFVKGFKTIFSLFYEGRSGRPFSYLYDGDANGDGQYGNDLIYVPASEDEIILESNNWDELNDFINSDDALKDARGKIIDRNTAREPWVNQLDFRIAQQIPTFSNHRLELTFDVINFLNLLNNDWGQQKYIPSQRHELFDFEGYDATTDKPKISFSPPSSDRNDDNKIDAEDIFSTDNLLSRWRIQIGLRYTF